MTYALVTGASRGIGRGIAIELALAGHQVYITGRNQKSLNAVQADFQTYNTKNSSGSIIPKVCDHSKDVDVDKLFSEIEHLDILINNAYSAVDALTEANEMSFHKLPIDFWDTVNHVGLRNHYRCCHHAVKIMLKNENSAQPGFLCNISSIGGANYLFGAAYGVGKEAKDRMMVDMSIDLKKSKLHKPIYCMSLWPGAVLTEKIQENINKRKHDNSKNAQRIRAIFQNGESTRFSGRCLAKILEAKNFQNKKFMNSLNGKIVTTSDLGDAFGILDVDNRVVPNMLGLKNILLMTGNAGLARFIPKFLKIPKWVLALTTYGKRFR